VEEPQVRPTTAKCEIDLQFFGDGEELTAVVEYASDLFEASTIERLLDHHECVLEELVADPGLRLSGYGVLGSVERRLLLEDWASTERRYDESSSIASLFERQVSLHAESLACVSAEGEVSYAELNRRANRVAHALRDAGVGPEVRVGLYAERSLDFVAGLLGIFNAVGGGDGGGYRGAAWLGGLPGSGRLVGVVLRGDEP
jgi:non-ribosomal peptide synthetase component F